MEKQKLGKHFRQIREHCLFNSLQHTPCPLAKIVFETKRIEIENKCTISKTSLKLFFTAEKKFEKRKKSHNILCR